VRQADTLKALFDRPALRRGPQLRRRMTHAYR
jgi:hypothetical protein